VCFFSEHGPIAQSIVLYHWIIPGRIAVLLLAFFFDYLPHYPHETTMKENRFKTTQLLDFGPVQAVATALLFFQDYHIVHHLYPTIPFWRYRVAWALKKDSLIKEKGIRIRKIL
jgi:fatty acid desaturase